MKKTLAILLALVAIGGLVFAEDAAPALKITGSVYGAAVLQQGATDGNWDAGTVYFNRNYGAAGYNDQFRARINMAYDDGNYGLKVRLQSSDFGTVTTPQAYGYMKFFNGFFKTSFGKLGDYSYATASNLFGNFDGATGALLQVYPVAGLSVGAYVPVLIAEDTSAHTVKNMGFGLSYSMDKVANFVAGYKLNAADDRDYVYAGVDVKAVENLLARVEAKFSNLGDDVNGETYIWERVAYTMGDLTAQVSADQTIWAKSGAAFGYSVTPYVGYAIGKTNLGLGVTYAAVNNSGTLDSTTDPLVIATKTTNGIEIDPAVTFTLGAHELELGAAYGIDDLTNTDTNWYRLYSMFTWNF